MDLTILNKKLMPERIRDVSGDTVHYFDEKLLITSFEPPSSRMGVAHTVSFSFLDRGYRISKKYDEHGTFLYWYCDIIHASYNKSENTLLITDLIVDVGVWPNGFVQLVDLDEMAEAVKNIEISHELISHALLSLHNLLHSIYSQQFPPKEITKFENK